MQKDNNNFLVLDLDSILVVENRFTCILWKICVVGIRVFLTVESYEVLNILTDLFRSYNYLFKLANVTNI